VAAVAEQRHRDEQPVSGQGFGSLYYTDCLPGQGLRGGAGFQFQAVSRDVDHDTMALVQRSTLYEAPVGWMREHRPVEEYPPSLTHVFDGRYVTARGVYLGAEANGVREGNQFTHAVATEDAEAYGIVRPAQLWDAPWWSERPATGSECDPVDSEPEIGPWGIDAVREWILRQPSGEEWLIAVHSAIDRVHDDERQRLLFVSTDPTPVLCWLAAATLLLPQTRAVRVTFRVFATNPQYSEHDVLALHPDWAGQFADARGTSEFAVFNVDTGEHSPVSHTEAATEWVPRFLRDDPFDVIDAIEMAHQFAGAGTAVSAHETRASTSDFVASRVVLFNEPATDPRESALLTTWLASRSVRPAEEVVVPVVNAILAGEPSVPVLRELDAATHRHGAPEAVATTVRRALLEAEVAALVAGTQPEADTERLSPATWSATELEQVTALVEGAAGMIDPPRFIPLLHTATRFGVTPREHLFHRGIHRFVQWWVDHPDERVDLERLPCRTAMIDQLRDELAHRMAGPAAEKTTEVIQHHFWQLLHHRIDDPSAPLDRTVAAAAVARGGKRLRGTVLTTVLGRIVYLRPDNVVDIAWAATFRYAQPTVDELVWLLRSLPSGPVSRPVAGKAYEALDKATRATASTGALDALELLALRGATPPRGRLADLTDPCTALTRWARNLATTRQRPDAAALADIRSVSPTVLRLRADKVINALIAGTTLDKAAHAVDNGNNDLCTLLAGRLPTIWADRDANDGRRNTAVALAYLILSASSCDDATFTELTAVLRKWAVGNGSRHDGVEKLLHAVGADYARTWKQDVTTGKLAPKKVGARRSSTSEGRGKPVDKKEKQPIWRRTLRRGRE
jgi:hypothetical protein